MTDRFKALQIVWLALLLGFIVWATVAYVLLTIMGTEMPGMPPIVIRVVAPTAVLLMAAALVLRRRALETIPPSLQGDERIARYQTALIPSLALIEGAGLLVVVISMVSNRPTWIPTTTAITFLMMVIARPRRDEMESAR